MLRPDQLQAYRAARWLVSGQEKARRSGRSFVLAAAFIREMVEGRSSRIWDHGVEGLKGVDFMEDVLRSVGKLLRVEVRVQAGVLRGVSPIITDERGVPLMFGSRRSEEKETLAAAVKTAFRSGMEEHEIYPVVSAAIYEELVDTVHSR